ncbi:hypothetical protein D1007_26498 [Hordeum vulgare]|nr:hypothetical protein D1007_26498 [Hordeum vulgare]
MFKGFLLVFALLLAAAFLVASAEETREIPYHTLLDKVLNRLETDYIIYTVLMIWVDAEAMAKKEEPTADVQDYYRGGGGYPGRGYPGRGRGGGYYPYPGRGGGGYPGRGGGGYCRWGCCGRGYYGGCRCCSRADEVPEPMYRAEAEVHH